jgi:hypothetical protein
MRVGLTAQGEAALYCPAVFQDVSGIGWGWRSRRRGFVFKFLLPFRGALVEELANLHRHLVGIALGVSSSVAPNSFVLREGDRVSGYIYVVVAPAGGAAAAAARRGDRCARMPVGTCLYLHAVGFSNHVAVLGLAW